MPAQFEPTLTDLSGRLDALARFSGEGPGVTRLVYDDAWCEAQRWLADQARALGLRATCDWAGNLFFHDPNLEPGQLDRPALFVGSHLDSVRHGGKYDGAYGTISGLLLAAAQLDAGGLPVVGFVTCEEEDSRFHGGMMGARSLLGRVDESELDEVADAAGVTWRAALGRVRARGAAAMILPPGPPYLPLFAPALMLELHIEQGPALARQGLALGIVERIAGYRRWSARITGAARHSGTTPMAMRHDAIVGAAEMILAIEAIALEAGDPAVATSGRVMAEPGLYNVVPGECELWLEARHDRAGELDRLANTLEARCRDIAGRRGLKLALGEGASMPPTELSQALGDSALGLARELKLMHRAIPSGAAHDTMVFAQAGVPALMLFVPSRDGISHSPDEYTAPEELFAGLSFALALIRRWGEKPPAQAAR